jgi:hypothetical protein
MPLARVVCTALLFLAASVPLSSAQKRPRPGEHLHDVLYNLEQQLANAEKNQDKAYFQRALDNNLVFVAYDGLVFTKTKIVDDLHYIDVKRYSIENIKVRRLGGSAGLVTYDLLLKGSIAGHNLPQKQYASSVWVKRGASWLLIFHQSTPAHHG